jgi:hypothetical protein
MHLSFGAWPADQEDLLDVLLSSSPERLDLLRSLALNLSAFGRAQEQRALNLVLNDNCPQAEEELLAAAE